MRRNTRKVASGAARQARKAAKSPSQSEKRHRCISVRFSDQEVAKLRAMSRGRKLSALLRLTALGHQSVVIPEPNVNWWSLTAALMESLNAITGSNVAGEFGKDHRAQPLAEIRNQVEVIRLAMVGAER